MPSERLLGRSVLLLSVVGLALSLALLYVHRQLAGGDGGYTSFCNIGETVNCDAVLGSPYATFMGLPVAAWSAVTYAVLILLARVAHPGARIAVVVVAAWAAGFSLVMGIVSVGVLHTVCLMCSGLYVVNAALLVAGALHAGRRGRGAALTAAVVPFVIAVVVGGAAARASWRAAAGPVSLAELREQNPDFDEWYLEQPVVAAAAVLPAPPVHIRGLETAPVTIVEYSDFACQHCARAYQDLERLLARQPGEVRLVFRHFPLDKSCNVAMRRSVHPTACDAAAAAECAGEAGRFWEFHDYLFEHQGESDFERIARNLGLDVDRFRDCMQSGRGRPPVLRDVAAAVDLGVDSTPTLFINGRTVRGALDASLYDYALAIEAEDRSSGNSHR